MEHHVHIDVQGLEQERLQADAPGDARHPVAISYIGCLLLVLLLSAGCNPAPDPPGVRETSALPIETEPVRRIPHGTEIFRQPIHSFVVVEEESEIPAFHAPSRWVHLTFDAPDRRVNVTLTDDGARLYASATSAPCAASVQPLQYQRTRDERRLYADMASVLENMVNTCGRRMEDADQYLRLFERVKPEFPEAIRAMKARVEQAFGREMERCRLPKPGREFDPNHPCG